MVILGLKETRSLSSLYERWYDPPRVCLNENIGKNTDRTIYCQSNVFHTLEIETLQSSFPSVAL